MARVIILSNQFPKYHPRAREYTGFVEKFLSGEKKHTIRAGKRWKPGDMFSPRYWSGIPRRSKQVIIGPDREVKKVWDISIVNDGEKFIVVIWYAMGDQTMGVPMWITGRERLAENDGLSFSDFRQWFNEDRFIGQIICWDETVEY